MYSKLTLLGAQNSGKTMTLRYLVYLILKHNAGNINGIILKLPNCSVPRWYPSFSAFPFGTAFVDTEDISIKIIIIDRETNKEHSICVCTGGDTCNHIISNWKIASANKCISYNSSKRIDIQESDIFISACRDEEEVVTIEQFKQRGKLMSQNNSVNLLYWFKTGVLGTFDDVIKRTSIDTILFNEAENHIFSGKAPSKVTLTHKSYCAHYATLIEKKLYELSKLI